MNSVTSVIETPLLEAPIQVATTQITNDLADSGQVSGVSLTPNGQASASTPTGTPPRQRRSWLRLTLLALIIAGGTAAIIHEPTRDQVGKSYRQLASQVFGSQAETAEAQAQSPPQPIPTWDGRIELTESQIQTIGLETAEVLPQTEPARLEIDGTTAYDPNTQIQVRPRFTSVIDKVYVNLGQQVKAGDPLVDLFSAELAAAKSDYEKAQALWEHDRQELERAEKLFHDDPPAISAREYLAMVNDERVSRAEAKVAADKLLLYGVSEENLAKVADEIGTEKAKMTLYAHSDGIVIVKDVVRGNRYDDDDVMLVIAPLDVFWVWGNVYPNDATRVEIGQRWVVRTPLLEQEIPSLVESITPEIAQDTKTVRIRTEIPNLDGRLKADLLVGGYVEIPPLPNRYVIPRLAMVSTDGADYVFIAQSQSDSEGPLSFERREIQVVEESHDRVIVAGSLREGETVATRGSLLLEQMYEDAMAVEPGAPMASIVTH